MTTDPSATSTRHAIAALAALLASFVGLLRAPAAGAGSPRNVILCIGDGMGPEHVRAAGLTDLAHVHMVFQNGCVANLTASRISAKAERKMRLFQKNRYFSIDFSTPTAREYTTEGQSGSETPIVEEPLQIQPGDALLTEIQAFLAAVRGAILTHHYVFGEDRIFDDQTGDAPQVLSDANADALLCVYMKGIVPTTGRKWLKGTAIVVSLITGRGIHVSTNEAVIMLMLVDAQDGQVLWFDVHSDDTYVGGKRRLRDFVKKGCAFLLKPRK